MNTLQRLIVFVTLLAVFGCGRDDSPPTGAITEPAAVDGTVYLLTTEPEDAATVLDVRESAKDGDNVVIVGRIGGSVSPWIEGRAAFTIVDATLRACSDIEGDQCQTPWDYCCETDKLPTSTALVKVVDDSGATVKAGAKDLLSLKELDTVVVRGEASRDDAGNLVILAGGVFVKK